ncbi:MAG: tRNA uridine-5-carboxymethylaminomethyl(34) synthesis GTPase MnmE [Alphaproteobacteria bacterium]|nr:tRNA uridine-5-carboxymethylaminomethyl(34) synthesis GTPase MnmE [Alphaproteobacteria bacterium]
MSSQTIFAPSTVYGKSGVAVIRISGEKALDVVRCMSDVSSQNILPRHAYFCKLYDGQTNEILDHALILYFKAPHSFTGEDIVEIQCHGSKAVLKSVLESLSGLEGFRLAEPGEFSKRAFYNQKMDLTEAEGLADLIDAETSAQQKQALRQMSGNLKQLYGAWREKLLKIYAYLEAYIDFPEEHIDEKLVAESESIVQELIKEIKEHLNASQNGERLREGFHVAIIGPVNAGKSSLMNAMVQLEAVIVSDVAGTTRDAVDVYLDMSGYPVILTDTAGLRLSDDKIEQRGVEIAHQKAKDADLIIGLFDASKDNKEVLGQLDAKKVICVANKADKLTDEQRYHFEKEGCLLISTKTSEGLSALTEKMTGRIQNNISSSSSQIITRVRYRQSLKECLENLEAFNLNKEIELACEDVRLAARALGKITGQVESSEILDKIFGTFCIGK